jgi:hypothetical protein
MAQRRAEFPEPATRDHRSEGTESALCLNPIFLLRAHAAWEMLRERKIWCCRAAEKPAIHAECSKDQGGGEFTYCGLGDCMPHDRFRRLLT